MSPRQGAKQSKGTMSYKAKVTSRYGTSTASATMLYQESDIDIGLEFSLWRPNSSVSVFSTNNGQNEMVDSVLAEIHEFVCLETNWILVASIDELEHDHCSTIRSNNNAATHHNKRLLRHLVHPSLRERALLQHDVDMMPDSALGNDITATAAFSSNANNDEIVVVLKDPQMMVKDEAEGHLKWTSWTFQYSVLESSRLISANQFYSRLQTIMQGKLDINIENGHLEQGLQETLPGAMVSVIGEELKTFPTSPSMTRPKDGATTSNTFTTTTTTTTTTVTPEELVPSLPEKVKFDPATHGLRILGVFMLLATIGIAFLLVTLSRKRHKARRQKELEEQQFHLGARPIDVLNEPNLACRKDIEEIVFSENKRRIV